VPVVLEMIIRAANSRWLSILTRIVRFAAVAATFLSVSVSAATAAEWRITRVSGDVRVHGVDQVWVKARRMQVLKPGESVWTGRRSRAQIETEDGSVILRSGSLVKVPAQRLPDDATVLFQGKGNVKAKVEKRDKRHFSIQTPYLAAVVKGTEFTIDMGSQTTSLSVNRGSVGAVSVGSRQEVSVGAGQALSMANKKDAAPGSVDSGSDGSDSGTSDGNDVIARRGEMAGSMGSSRRGGRGGGWGGGCRRCGGWGFGWRR
jgi:hypothetical protein